MIYTKTATLRQKPVLDLGAINLSHGTFAHRVEFQPIPGKTGVYAILPSPESGYIRSFAMLPDGVAPSGNVFVSTVNPTVSYEGAFLYTVLDNIPVTTTGPAMWRKTDIYNAAYATAQLDNGMLYLMVLGGPAGLAAVDVTMTIDAE